MDGWNPHAAKKIDKQRNASILPYGLNDGCLIASRRVVPHARWRLAVHEGLQPRSRRLPVLVPRRQRHPGDLVWWLRVPRAVGNRTDGNFSRDPEDSSSEARGATDGLVGAVGIALRREQIDELNRELNRELDRELDRKLDRELDRELDRDHARRSRHRASVRRIAWVAPTSIEDRANSAHALE